jgi:hypothetical protein
MSDALQPITDYLTKNGFTHKIEEVEPVNKHWAKRSYEVTITDKYGNRIVLPFHTGSAVKTFTVEEVLYSAYRDAQYAEDYDLVGFLGDMGYTSDKLRDGETTYKACHEINKKLDYLFDIEFKAIVLGIEY